MPVSLSHGNDVVDAPHSAFSGAAPELNANRADLDFYAVVFEVDAVIIVSLRVDHSAKEQVHAPMIPPCRPEVKPLDIGLAPSGRTRARGVRVDTSRAASTSPADRSYHLIDLRFFSVDGGTGAEQRSFHGAVTHAV